MSSALNYDSTDYLPVIELPTSKSIANRLLIAQAISKSQFEIHGLSEAKDTYILSQALRSNETEINVGMAGTAFRFLTAYYAILKGERVLTGAERMKKRPIKILVSQLKKLGADIDYLEKEGYPPLRIFGKELKSGILKIDGSVSSQYITALLLIAPVFQEGLTIHLQGEIVSLPYIDMTIQLIKKLGVEIKRRENSIEIKNGEYFSIDPIQVEADWSSAAFFYQLVAFNGKPLKIKSLLENSIQGDQRCAELFQKLGVSTEFLSDEVLLKPINEFDRESQFFNMGDCPDLIPSVSVVASQLINETTIQGVSTLRIKECDRVEALKNELGKVGVEITEIDNDTIRIKKGKGQIKEKILFEVYNDHRMAMCLAPLATIFTSVSIDDAKVVEKSFPGFWKEIAKVGITIQ